MATDAPSVCLNCGCDLGPFVPIEIGSLTITSPETIRWNGAKVVLTTQQRLVVLALARARGGIMRRIALAEAAGSETLEDPCSLIAVNLHRIRAAFRAIDPSFDAIETVWGVGVRWKVERDDA